MLLAAPRGADGWYLEAGRPLDAAEMLIADRDRRPPDAAVAVSARRATIDQGLAELEARARRRLASGAMAACVNVQSLNEFDAVNCRRGGTAAPGLPRSRRKRWAIAESALEASSIAAQIVDWSAHEDLGILERMIADAREAREAGYEIDRRHWRTGIIGHRWPSRVDGLRRSPRSRSPRARSTRTRSSSRTAASMMATTSALDRLGAHGDWDAASDDRAARSSPSAAAGAASSARCDVIGLRRPRSRRRSPDAPTLADEALDRRASVRRGRADPAAAVGLAEAELVGRRSGVPLPSVARGALAIADRAPASERALRSRSS